MSSLPFLRQEKQKKFSTKRQISLLGDLCQLPWLQDNIQILPSSLSPTLSSLPNSARISTFDIIERLNNSRRLALLRPHSRQSSRRNLFIRCGHDIYCDD